MASTRQRRRRALAAGGIVLGIGAVLVAASWTDKVLGNSQFGSGSSRFGIESSINGTSWTSHAIGNPNPLTFTTPATGLVPGSTVYAPVQLRTEEGSSAASVLLKAATFSGTGVGNLSTALRYRVVSGAATCTATAFTPSSTYVIGATGAVSLNTDAPAPFSLSAGAGPTVPGAALPLCFEITLPPDPANWTNPALQGKTLVANWQFVGTS